MVTRTLSTHGRSKQNVDVVSARSVFGFGFGLGFMGAIGLFFGVLTHHSPNDFYNHTYHGILFVCCCCYQFGIIPLSLLVRLH